MINTKRLHWGSMLLSTCLLGCLLFRFGPFIQPQSFDLVQHYLLVNEIMKHGTIMPDAFSRMGAMAVYPPIAHWMAAVIGWIGGSGLVGITLISIASVYITYLLIVNMIGTVRGIILFFILFLLFRFTRAQVGWEIVTNFFYPQLVAGVVYFSVLLWASRDRGIWRQATGFITMGTVSMWIQPLVAMHILAAGITLSIWKLVEGWRSNRPALFLVLIVSLASSALIVAFHPAFKVMRTISGNDGYLVFGFSHTLLVAVLCGAVGAYNLYRRYMGNAQNADTVLGCAAIAGLGLVLLQAAALTLYGDGSAYAVKKHMFLLVTLGLINFVRIVAGHWATTKNQDWAQLLGPIAAGIMSAFILRAFNWPVAPVINAMTYAEHVARYHLPEFVTGNTVDDTSPLLLSNVITSLTSFEHPFDAQAIGWLHGKKISDGATFVMVPRTPEIDRICSERFAENEQFVTVRAVCLNGKK